MFRNNRLLFSFQAAGKGILTTIKEERNLRIHLTAAVFILYFKGYYSLTNVQEILLLLTIGMVVSLELMNTAVENAVDLYSMQQHPLAGKAKDAAAGAVLAAALIAVVIGIRLFWNVDAFISILSDFLSNPFKAVILILAVAVGCWFIFCFGQQPEKQ